MTNHEDMILLVEDDETIVELEKRVLSRAGWRVRAVNRVSDAVALLAERSFQAIVLDYRLPDGDPWTVIEAANLKIPRVPVIMVTAMGSEGVAAEALHRGVSSYVTKTHGFWQEIPEAIRRVTEAAAVEQSLHLSDALFQLIAAKLSDVIVAGDLQGRVTYISPACKSVLGYQPEELKALLGLELVHPDDRKRVSEFLASIDGHGRTSLIYRCRGKLGGFRWLESNVNLLSDQEAGTPQVVVISCDITERKEAEEQITNLNVVLEGRVAELKTAGEALVSARQRAEEANRAKSDFLAAMSHEIRTPMNAILGMTDLLMETELGAVQRDYIDRCRRAGTTLLTLINDLLDLSKIESGRFELEEMPFDLEELVERTTEIMEPKAQQKGVGMVARITQGTPTNLVGDSVRLQQILINLLGNAVKFTEHGEVSLAVSRESGDPGHLRFEVIDTGIGIPDSKLASIFEDFIQAESSITRRYGGTGLGLGIARRLVNRMDGDLTVSSVLGKGSIFSFDAVFPLNDQPMRVELSHGAQDLVGRRVLIVDNNSTNRLILSKMCLTWGMLPLEADSAANACLLVDDALREERPFSLAILDALMPEVDGFEALAQIRRISPETPVIITSSNNQPGDATRARALGASAFAVKPVRRSELLRLVTAALRSVDQPARDAAASDERSGGGNGNTAEILTKILVAEDSEDNRFLLRAYLSGGAYNLTFVENGHDALRMFEKEAFDLVLMDVQMPLMDGLEATGWIRSFERRTARSPTAILALTAHALVEDVERSRAAGCDGHLTKPISKEKLITAIENFRFVSQAVG